MSVLDQYFEFQKLQGELAQILIRYRKKLHRVHGAINMHHELDPASTTRKKQQYHREIKDTRRAISDLIAHLRLDKKYG